MRRSGSLLERSEPVEPEGSQSEKLFLVQAGDSDRNSAPSTLDTSAHAKQLVLGFGAKAI